jgi:hypothetical protein
MLAAFGKAGVFENRDDTVVSRNQPSFANPRKDGQFNPADGLFCAKASIKREGISLELTAEEVDMGGGQGALILGYHTRALQVEVEE